MALNKQSGNMYGWVTHTWNPVRGCEHECSYCYLKSFRNYNMTPRFVEKELKTNLGSGKCIFVGSTTDMFGDFIKKDWIASVLTCVNKYPANTYLFQSKNPQGFMEWLRFGAFPPKTILGTTIETNRRHPEISKAPSPSERAEYMMYIGFRYPHIQTMFTIEPIIDFDLDIILRWLKFINPTWVNVGADSKNHALPEPLPKKVDELILELKKLTEVRKKTNLKRLMQLPITPHN